MHSRRRNWPSLFGHCRFSRFVVNGLWSVGRNYGYVWMLLLLLLSILELHSNRLLLLLLLLVVASAAVIVVAVVGTRRHLLAGHVRGQLETICETGACILVLRSRGQRGSRLLLGQQTDAIVGIRMSCEIRMELLFAAIAAAAGAAAAQAAAAPRCPHMAQTRHSGHQWQ